MEDAITRQIVETLLSLAERKPLEKITMTELYQESGVSRTAFNNRFTDMNMLICSIWDTRILRNSWDGLDTSIEDYRLGCLLSLKRYKKYHRFMKQACRMTGQNCLRDHMVEASERFEQVHLSESSRRKYSEQQLRFLTRYHALAVNGLIIDWLEDNCRQSPEEFADLIAKARFALMETVF